MTWKKFPDFKPEDDETVLACQIDHEECLPVLCYYSSYKTKFYPIFTQQSIYIDVEYWMSIPARPI